MFRQFLGNDLNLLPTWWTYSIALGVFMVVLPFSRYMHIPAEMLLIPIRNAGIKIRNARKGLTKVMVYSCPNCGVCIDACPMTADKANVKDTTVYLTRQLRRNNERRIDEISDKCLMCDKCTALCQVGVEGAKLRQLQRSTRQYAIKPHYENIDVQPFIQQDNSRVMYFSGCMSQLNPTIGRSVESILNKAKIDYVWIDKEGGLCCGRPILLAGMTEQANELIEKNEKIIRESNVDTLLVSCPICYKMFRERYNIPTVKVVHYVSFIMDLISNGRLAVEKSDVCYVYHDPCELGRGCGMYEEPRKLLAQVATYSEAEKNRKESVCCGGSLGSLSLDFGQRMKITSASLENLYSSRADAIATACPLCQTTFARLADRPVKDIAQIVDNQTIHLSPFD